MDDTDIVADAISTDQRVSVAMRLLDARVPLSLLFDLLSPEGPDSEAILESERPQPQPTAAS
ncbi:MAG TPA: hypothetical protein VHB69_11475 [Mycobacteriales bacterium]|nr:hypothetical protein [Mycobacteriales bacterium]